MTSGMDAQREVAAQAEHVLDACLAAKVRAANRAVVAIYDRRLAGEATTSAQVTVLLTVAASGPASLSELASAAGLDLSSMQRSIAGLEDAGFVRIEAGHARTRIVSLTEAGEAKLNAVLPLWRAAQDEVAERLGVDAHELERIGRMLDSMKTLR